VAELVLVPVLRDRAGGEARDDAVADAGESTSVTGATWPCFAPKSVDHP